jgi:hypothetical protein
MFQILILVSSNLLFVCGELLLGLYIYDDTNSRWKDQMIVRLIKMLKNNVINIVNDVQSMNGYRFVWFTFCFTEAKKI